MSSFEYSFDEAILAPEGDEIVRAVFTRPLNEGNLREYCERKGIVSYLPLKKVNRVMRRAYKSKSYHYQNIVLRPMFPNYVFMKMKPEQRVEAFHSNAIIRILGDDVRENQEKLLNEIRLVHQIETIAMTEELEFNSGVKEGDRFLIESGPWQGVYGWLKKKRKRCIWTVEIECVNSLVQATIDPSLYKMTPVD